MKLRLLRDSRIRHYAGEIVEVSPDEAHFLLSTESAEPVPEDPQPEEAQTKTTTKRKAAK